MDPKKLEEKERVEQEIKKEANIPKDLDGDEAADKPEIKKEEKTATSLRQIPMFMIYFQVYDMVSKKTIVEFEDFSNSKVKSSFVKKETQTIIERVTASKQEKNRTVQTPSKFEGHAWMYMVNDKNWLFLRNLISFF